MSDDVTLRWLRDLEELRRLPQRYARAVDGRDPDALAGLFDPDGRVDGTRGAQSVPEFLAAMAATASGGASLHLLADPLVELEPGADQAAMDTTAVVYQVSGPEGGTDLTLGMRYQDQVVRRDGRWVVHHRRSTMLWMR